MHNKDDSCGRGRPVLPCVLLLLSLAGCQSFPSAEDPSSESPVAVATPELAPVAVPYIPFEAPIVAADDLLGRLRKQMSLPATDDAAVRREVTWYARHQPYIDRVFQRSEPYLFHIVEALQARNMPTDLALLPIVESAFDPFAYSHGRAAGLWQIIPGTGKRLGLRQNWWFDARRDVLESTRAALDYLQQLHAKFDGDWLLAVAGYNSGEGNVARAIRRAQADGRAIDFWGIQRYLPTETRTYVPRLLAIRELVANPAEHGITLPVLENEPYFVVVDTGGQIDMALAAKLAGIESDRLYALNAGVSRWATDPEGPHRLLLPVTHADAFTTGLADLGERERVQWTRHRVKQGETIGGLAETYATTAAVLREVNQLSGNTIRAGDYLLIPHATASLASYSQSADMRAERQQSTQRAGVRTSHVVRSGESLWTISRRYGVDVRALASWNSMAPGDVLSVGRKLTVWTPQPAVTPATSVGAAPETTTVGATSTPTTLGARAPAATTAAPQLALAPEAGGQIRQVTYVVRRGDSLYSIAQRFRVSVTKLVEWNDVSIQQYLQPGQRLVMFINVLEQSG